MSTPINPNRPPEHPFEGERPEGAPDGPFYWAISNALLAMDAASKEPGFDFERWLKDELGVDADTIGHVGEQRAVRSVGPAAAARAIRHVLAAAWMDGYVAATMQAKQAAEWRKAYGSYLDGID